MDLTDVVVRVTTEDGAIACLTQAVIAIGALAAGEERTTGDGFVFVVPPGVERAAVSDDLSAQFSLSISSAGHHELATTPGIALDLDDMRLIAAGTAGPQSR